MTASVALDALRIVIPVKCWSLNAERAGHWRSHRRRTGEARELARVASLQAIGAHPHRPVYDLVEIDAFAFAKVRRRRDPGNAYPTVKACIDGLVDAGVLEDDSERHVALLSFHPTRHGPDRLVLIVRPVDREGGCA